MFNNWAKATFILLPLLIIAADAALLFSEGRQSPEAKAIRLVRESKSRKENFTVQQYLYLTVYHRRGKGEAIEIEGWRAERLSDGPGHLRVEFRYREPTGERAAAWEVDLGQKRIAPLNDLANELSWH